MLNVVIDLTELSAFDILLRRQSILKSFLGSSILIEEGEFLVVKSLIYWVDRVIFYGLLTIDK